MTLDIGLPLVLLGLLLLPLFVLATRKSQFVLSRRRKILATALRAIVFLLVVLAAADVRLGLPTDDLAVLTVVDRSASISDSERTALDTRLATLAVNEDDVRFVSGGDRTADPLVPRLARDLTAGVAALPHDRVRRALLATDGREVDPDVLSAVAAARAGGVRVDVLPVGDTPPIDAIAISGIEVPRLVRAGERLEIGVDLTAGRPADVEIVARLDGNEVARTTARVAEGPGRQALTVQFPEEEGVKALEITARANGDVIAENDRHHTLVRVLSQPRVLLLSDSDTPPLLATVLGDAELEVDSRRLTAAPSTVAELDRFGLVVLDEADPGELSEPQQVAIRSFVEELGGGLLTITGENPVRRTPETLREIEPIIPPPAIPEPRPLELIIVIDRSSSMEGSKIMMARRAAIAAVQQLRVDALVGVVAFSGGADVVLAPVPVADDAQRQDVQGFIARIVASGGTNIAAALGAANSIMSRDPRYIHHTIVLSDGESDPAPAIAQANALAGASSITTITIGPHSQLMAEIARIGRGRYHVTNNPTSLPALFVREAQFRQPPAHRTGSIVPRVAMSHRAIEGIDFEHGPPILGHALAAERPGADTILASTDDSPILAHWHVGLGQVATYTSATTGGWANEQREWDGFRKLWSQTAWALMRARTVEPLELRAEAIRGRPDVRRVIAIAPGIGSAPMPVVRVMRGTSSEDDLDLVPIGPGVFAAEVEVGEGFLVDARMPADPEPTAAVAVDRPYPEELGRFGADAVALARLAELGGGSVLDAPERVVEAVESVAVASSLRLPLFAVALALYLLSLLVLRLPDPRAAEAVVRSSYPRISAPPSSRPGVAPKKKEAA